MFLEKKNKKAPKDQNYNLNVSFYKSRNVSISVRFVFAQVDSRRITSLEGLHKQATRQQRTSLPTKIVRSRQFVYSLYRRGNQKKKKKMVD